MSLYKFDILAKRISTDNETAKPTAMFSDAATGKAYWAVGASVQPLAAGTVRTAKWKSKKFRLKSSDRFGFAWGRVAGIINAGVVLRLYAEGALVYTTPTIMDGDPFRLPPNMARNWEVEVESADRVTSVTLARETKELL